MENGYEFFRLLMWHIHGITYPKSIFNRRIKLLSKKEKLIYQKKIEDDLFYKMDQKFHFQVEIINEIMAKRAEKLRDQWK